VGCAGLAIVEDQYVDRLARLSYGFEESDLPFRVDLVELNKVEPIFRDRIERHHEVIQVGNGRSEYHPLPQCGVHLDRPKDEYVSQLRSRSRALEAIVQRLETGNGGSTLVTDIKFST